MTAAYQKEMNNDFSGTLKKAFAVLLSLMLVYLVRTPRSVKRETGIQNECYIYNDTKQTSDDL